MASGGMGGASATGGMTGTPGTGGTSAAGGTTATGGTSAAGGVGGVGAGGAASPGGGSGGSTASGGNGVGGAQSGGGSPGAGGGVGAGGFALTSPVLTEGGMFPAANTCAGVDQSPELDWTPGPATAQSYALVLTDMAINLVHWVVWDIPVATRSLPAMLATTAALTTPPGAHQVSASGTGYMGPCPSGNVHTYVFDLHAVDVATLPAVPAKATSAQLKAMVLMHSLGKASLSAQSNAKGP
jgi:Raf kinase inhibitor-like YbhB/YbcL family protein